MVKFSQIDSGAAFPSELMSNVGLSRGSTRWMCRTTFSAYVVVLALGGARDDAERQRQRSRQRKRQTDPKAVKQACVHKHAGFGASMHSSVCADSCVIAEVLNFSFLRNRS